MVLNSHPVEITVVEPLVDLQKLAKKNLSFQYLSVRLIPPLKSPPMSARISGFFVCNKALNRQEILEQTHCHIRLYGIVENGLIVARNLRSRVCLPGLFLQ